MVARPTKRGCPPGVPAAPAAAAATGRPRGLGTGGRPKARRSCTATTEGSGAKAHSPAADTGLRGRGAGRGRRRPKEHSGRRSNEGGDHRNVGRELAPEPDEALWGLGKRTALERGRLATLDRDQRGGAHRGPDLPGGGGGAGRLRGFLARSLEGEARTSGEPCSGNRRSSSSRAQLAVAVGTAGRSNLLPFGRRRRRGRRSGCTLEEREGHALSVPQAEPPP